MSLPNDLIKAAILGTAKEKNIPSLQADSEENLEAALLLHLARLNLRRATNYPVKQNHLKLATPLPAESNQVANEASMAYLRLMIKGIHRFALREFLVAMAEANQISSDDVLPNLLLLGLKQADLQPYILPIIGQKGLYLAYEISNQNWKWVLNMETFSIGEVLAAERWQEDILIEQLQKNTWKWQRYNQENNLLLDLAAYSLVWSGNLTVAFIDYVRRVEKPEQRYGNWIDTYIGRQISQFAYRFPLNLAHPESFDSLPLEKVAIREMESTMRPITSFRQKMLAAISGG